MIREDHGEEFLGGAYVSVTYWAVYINDFTTPLAMFREKHHAENFLGLYEYSKAMKDMRPYTIVIGGRQ